MAQASAAVPSSTRPALTRSASANTMPFVREARRAVALLVLAGLFGPSASAAVVSLHLAAQHEAEHGEDHEHAADLSVLWHGHSHEATTPSHDHPLLVDGTHALWVPTARQVFVSAPGPWEHAALPVAGEQRVSRWGPPGLAGVGPPPCPERLSILRI